MNLARIRIDGFRSICGTDIELGPLNVMIGANGSGKSNLILFLQMLNSALSKGLQESFIPTRGPASALLHFGPRVTPVMRAELEFRTDTGRNFYRFTLAHAYEDTLVFTHEEVQYHVDGFPQPQAPVALGPGGHRESGLAELWSEADPTAKFVRGLLARCRVYQFHDTSTESFIRHKAKVADSSYLRANAGNLAAFLLRLREGGEEDEAAYRQIERTLRTVLPWFGEFVLTREGAPRDPLVLLRWRAAGRTEYEFGPGQLSDGSLRVIALVALLLQPEYARPQLIAVDEPELGLHPAAEEVIAGLFRNVSKTSQVIVATQSATFLDHFAPNDVVVVENVDGCSSFKRQTQAELRKWLERYTLGQLWNKNLIGGRP